MTECELLIFGVDGFNHQAIQLLTAKDPELMPTISELQKYAEYGEFESYIVDGFNSPHTGVCWPTLYTGLNEKGHGHTEGGWRQGDSHFHEITTIWDKISEATDKTQILYGMPMTYKAKKLNGWMISGFVHTTVKSLFKNAMYPEDLTSKDFIECTATWTAKCRMEEGVHPGMPESREKAYSVFKEAEEERLQKFRELVDKHGSGDIVAYGTTFADKMGHAGGINPAEEFTEKTYSFVDEMLEELIEILNPKDIVIISDHGFSNYSHDLYGYYLDTTGKGMDSIFDFAPWMMNYLGLEYNEEEYGVNGELQGLSDEEKQDIRGRLEDMGYIEDA